MTTNAPIRQQSTQILQQSLAECGIAISLQYWVPSEIFSSGPDGPLFGRRFDIGQFAWVSSIEPPCELYTSEQIPGPLEEGGCGWGCSNRTAWANEDFDQACYRAQNSLPGQANYKEYHLLAQEIFAEELPIIPLFQRNKIAVTRLDMCGFILDPTATSEMWNIEEFGYGELCDH